MNLFVHYFSFNQKRADKLWKNFADDLAKTKTSVTFDMYMNPLKRLAHPEEGRDEDSVLINLKFLDLNYGSEHCEPVESGKLEYPLVEALTNATGLQLTYGETPKKDWVQLFSKIDNNIISKVADSLIKKMGWANKEGQGILFEFLQNIHPIVKDLKKNKDSIFISYADTSDEVSPDTAENF